MIGRLDCFVYMRPPSVVLDNLPRRNAEQCYKHSPFHSGCGQRQARWLRMLIA